MSIWARMFSSTQTSPIEVQPAGLVEDEGGWYYEETCELTSSRLTIRIEQDRPGDWYVHEGCCEVAGLDDAGRAEEVARFFAGRYRWLELDRESFLLHGVRGCDFYFSPFCP